MSDIKFKRFELSLNLESNERTEYLTIYIWILNLRTSERSQIYRYEITSGKGGVHESLVEVKRARQAHWNPFVVWLSGENRILATWRDFAWLLRRTAADGTNFPRISLLSYVATVRTFFHESYHTMTRARVLFLFAQSCPHYQPRLPWSRA